MILHFLVQMKKEIGLKPLLLEIGLKPLLLEKAN